jgi:multiple sugar transport system permease protein
MTDLQTAVRAAEAAATRPVRHRPGGPWWLSLLKHVALVAVGVVMVYPLLWMVVSSLRPTELIFRSPGLVLTDLQVSNYREGWNALQSPFGRYLVNSALVVLGSILGNLVSCSMAAYAFARLRFRGRRLLFGVMLVTIMLPGTVTMVPQYVIFSNLGWVNTFYPLVVPKFLATDAFFVFLMVQFIRAIPRELDEAARLDGCGFYRTYLRIVLPLMVPALATTAVFTFIWTWGDFFGQLIYLTDPARYTVSVALSTFSDSSSQTSWGPLFAMSVVSLVPVLLVFLLGQRYLIRGIATTGGR